MSNSEMNDRVFYSTVVLEHIVPSQNRAIFRKWHTTLIHSAKRHQGFLRADSPSPLHCLDGVVKWYSIVHFDTPNHLNVWLNSRDRATIVESGQKIFQNYKFKSFTTGLEGWFSTHAGQERSSLGTPPWKQVMSVVLGLYPLVMIQSKLIPNLSFLQSWSPAFVTLMSNFIVSSLLTWIVMPQITQALHFWLQPAFRLSDRKTNLLGSAIVLAALGLMVSVFQHF
ncbi:MAG: hypothetical protein MUC48_09130 [Leptolyngbya sp. Prado105]|jgi:hypothetical protein|nr:hypothetical protein [Leptolyngbya sp. Prado105]